MIPVRRSPVSATVTEGSERVQVTGHLLGRLTRFGGVPTLAEVEVDGTGRTALVPVADVQPLDGAARAQMDDAGPSFPPAG